MEDRANKLIVEVLKWWKEHEYDTVAGAEDEFNVYDDEPIFVTLTKQLNQATSKEPIDRGYLSDWYQASIDETIPPVWTDEHLDELFNDFILIPKGN